MRSNLDALMQENGVDALIISGPAMHNPAMVYMTAVAMVTSADVIKKRGEPAVIFNYAIERDEAAKSGLRMMSYGKYPMNDLLREASGDTAQAMALRYQRMLNDVGITSGKVVLYGLLDAGLTYAVYSRLAKLMPGIEFDGDLLEKIMLSAMETKDEGEVARIRRMGQITTSIVGRAAEFLTSQKVESETLVHADGRPVTIGDVKSLIRLWVAESGAETPEETIFAIGRDSGVPHNTGTLSNALRLGQTIIFDFFPAEAGGGFFYDFTRSWSLGYATDEALKLYEDVKSVYDQLASELKLGAPTTYYMKKACELFEAQGHPSVLSDPATEVGFCHGLGHGVGLNIHERPWFSLVDRGDVLLPGSVVTLEPGLYYPERGLGVRLEDTYWLAPDGRVEKLAEYPMDLVLKMKK